MINQFDPSPSVFLEIAAIRKLSPLSLVRPVNTLLRQKKSKSNRTVELDPVTWKRKPGQRKVQTVLPSGNEKIERK